LNAGVRTWAPLMEQMEYQESGNSIIKQRFKRNQRGSCPDCSLKRNTLSKTQNKVIELATNAGSDMI
jgi:hypothetical protein